MHINASSSNPAPTCHVCDRRGGCLGLQLINSQQFHERLNHARRVIGKGDHLFHDGESADSFYVVRSGSIKSYLVTEEGEEQVLGFYLPGDVVGLDSDDGSGRMSSAVALETTSVCRFPHSQLADKSVGINILKLAAEQMQRDHNLVLMLARKDADGRIASFLIDLSKRYSACGYSKSSFLLTMSRQDIACYLGLAVETVSRTLTRFQESGVLSVKRREVEILDYSVLCSLGGIRLEAGPVHNVVSLASA